MSDYRLIGLEGIAIGSMRAGPGFTGTLTSIYAIVPDSAVIACEQPGDIDLMVEDSDYPDITLNTPGDKYIEFATRDMAMHNFILALGGTSGATVWNAPNDAVVISEKSIKAISKEYNGKQYEIELIHVNLKGGGDLRFSKTESGTLTYRGKIMRPVTLKTDYPIVARVI